MNLNENLDILFYWCIWSYFSSSSYNILGKSFSKKYEDKKMYEGIHRKKLLEINLYFFG